MQTPFVLSHHHPDGYHRCVRIAGLHVCARCLGLYPTMFAVIGVQIALRAGKVWPWDLVLVCLTTLPVLVDWARGRLDSATGTNASRLVTGMLLGIGLGRTLYLHLREPGHPLAMAHFGAMAAVFLVVEAVVRLRRGRADRKQAPDVPPDDRSGSGP